jgi:hypothetical protein
MEKGGKTHNKITFSVDSQEIDEMLYNSFDSQLEYDDKNGDILYKLPKRQFDRLIDMADSRGFDVDYENSEESVIIVYDNYADGGKLPTITKEEWSKKQKDSKLKTEDGKYYIMKYDDKIGTYLQEVKVLEDGGELSKSQELKSKIEKILDKVLPGFYKNVFIRKNYFDNGEYIGIIMAASNYEINRVKGQYPQDVSLMLDVNDMDLHVQVFGGNGGNRIYLVPDKNDPKEKYLAMAGVKIPFRTPKKEEKFVLQAIEKFAESYKNSLKENKDRLFYKEYVDYDTLIMADGGFVDKSDEELKSMNDDELFAYLDAKAAYMKQYKRPLSAYKAKNFAANATAVQYQKEGTSKLEDKFPSIEKINEQATKDYQETIAKKADKMVAGGQMDKKINGYDVDYYKTARGVYANIEIPSSNPTFDDDTQIKGFGKDENEAFNDLKKEFEKYLNSKDNKMADGGKLKELLSKAKSATVKVYEKSKDYTKKQVHDQKKNIALEVISDTKGLYKTKWAKNNLQSAENLVDLKYVKGGKVKFEDKVKAVQKNLLINKKVPLAVQKDYGKTYNKAEAKESAQRIIGSQTAKWNAKNKMAKGGKTAISSLKDRIIGSKKNKVGTASSKTSAKDIELNDSIIEALSEKAKEYNKKHSSKVSTSALKAVMRRGMGAFSSSHRPGMTRQGWGYARVNKFLLKKGGTKVKATYTQDNDLLENGGELKKEMKVSEQPKFKKLQQLEDKILHSRNRARNFMDWNEGSIGTNYNIKWQKMIKKLRGWDDNSSTSEQINNTKKEWKEYCKEVGAVENYNFGDVIA